MVLNACFSQLETEDVDDDLLPTIGFVIGIIVVIVAVSVLALILVKTLQ